MRYLISFFVFSAYLYGFNYHLKPYKISEGINCFFGLPSQVREINGGNMVNSCYVESSEGYIVIDSGPTYAYAQEAYSIMKKKKNLPVKYVINTSWDEVHVLGNEFYKELGAKLLGPKGYKEHIERKETLFLETKLSASAFLNTRIVSLDNYIEKDKTLIFEKMKIEIKTLEGDNNYLYVYIEDKDIVFAGDLVFNNRIAPLNNGRSLLTWIDGLDKLSTLKWSDIISSHGYMTRRSALKNTKSYLSLLKNEVLEGIRNKKSREEIVTNVKFTVFEKDKFYKIWHHKNVTKAYDELKIFVNKNKVITENNDLSFQIAEELKKLEIKEPKSLNKPKLEVIRIVEAKPKPKKIPKKNKAVKYKSFNQAINSSKVKNKIVLIKVRSTICKYCDQLDRIIAKNSKVQKILNKYFELVKINTDYEDVPMSLTVRSTPTLIFIRPDNKKVLMQLAGIRALGELLDVLNEAVDDGHNDAYLRP
jgi:glyoxylase-like metal-dependent hydrolase (beta-lactamase superfamily II)/thiol-disulfide isomerase/thioredoxin